MTHKKVTLAKVTAKNDPPESTRSATHNDMLASYPLSCTTTGIPEEKQKLLSFPSRSAGHLIMLVISWAPG